MGQRGPKPEFTERVVTYVTPSDLEWLDEMGAAAGNTRSDVIREALLHFRKWIKRRQGAK